jgi:hypothetical protein
VVEAGDGVCLSKRNGMQKCSQDLGCHMAEEWRFGILDSDNAGVDVGHEESQNVGELTSMGKGVDFFAGVDRWCNGDTRRRRDGKG